MDIMGISDGFRWDLVSFHRDLMVFMGFEQQKLGLEWAEGTITNNMGIWACLRVGYAQVIETDDKPSSWE
jgi:hypothetical protein